MVQAVEAQLKRVNPYELHTAFKAIAGLMDAVTCASHSPCRWRPACTRLRRRIVDIRFTTSAFEADLVDGSFGLQTTVTTDVTTLCPCSKAISDYGAHNQRSRVSLTVRGEDDAPYPVAASELVQLIRDSCVVPGVPGGQTARRTRHHHGGLRQPEVRRGPDS